MNMGGSGATLTAYLKDDRSRKTDQVLKEWKRDMQKWSDCSVSLESQSSLGSGMSMGNAEDLEYILVSTQYDDLKKYRMRSFPSSRSARMRQTSTLPLKTALPL